jgi:hypothetical protein
VSYHTRKFEHIEATGEPRYCPVASVMELQIFNLASDSRVFRPRPLGLVKEQLYTSASVIGTPRIAATTGEYKDLSQ